QWCVFIRYLPNEPSARLPLAIGKDLSLRPMSEADVETVSRLIPFELDRAAWPTRSEKLRRRLDGAVVAMRGARIVGATWYADEVHAGQPWFALVQPHLRTPAWFTVNTFVAAGERGVALPLVKNAGEQLSRHGVRSLVSMIQATNEPSLLIARLVGARLV